MELVGLLGLLIPLAGMATGVTFMVLIYKLITRWSDRRHVSGYDELVADLARVRADLDAMMDATDRVQELEERLDFAERLLAQTKSDRLSAGS